MNVWAIEKELPLKLLLFELVHRYGQNILTLNNKEMHFQAIDINKPDEPDLSAYIFTFGQNAGRYGIDLRYPDPTYNIVGGNEGLTIDQTIEIIAIHLLS
jgi:hypothetical protein